MAKQISHIERDSRIELSGSRYATVTFKWMIKIKDSMKKGLLSDRKYLVFSSTFFISAEIGRKTAIR